MKKGSRHAEIIKFLCLVITTFALSFVEKWRYDDGQGKRALVRRVTCAEKRANNHVNSIPWPLCKHSNPSKPTVNTVLYSARNANTVARTTCACASSVDSVPFIKPTIREPLTKTRRD